jgi:hypothetical protein
LTKKKVDVDKKIYAKKEEETSINNVAATSKKLLLLQLEILPSLLVLLPTESYPLGDSSQFHKV